MTQELSLTSMQLVTEKARAEVAEASLVANSACLDESTMECDKLRLLLVDTKCQMGKDLVDAQIALGKVKARVAKAEVKAKAVKGALNKAKARVAKAEARAKAMEGFLVEAKNQASTAKEALVAESAGL